MNVGSFTRNMKPRIQSFWRNEDGIGTLEVLLIIAVIVVIFLLFKDFIMSYVSKLISNSGSKMDEALK
ncbi:MAG: multidrug transporter [Candidatus Pristimantibacillus lignocellulolyticus]|uniref:Multidrug transporter n=1 Tax=Candidatus Pristimantibacillus lignocellulolyticus TaxID=2994561 RepID=A0A9J6Z9J6_9BACL|nr:MAG: multidrug transporter [Candidatus Pristimantibacillus lignocellulolyticus]